VCNLKKLKCYLDRRRNCFHSKVEQKICEKNKMICEEMKPIRGEWHDIMKHYKWVQERPGYADESNIRR